MKLPTLLLCLWMPLRGVAKTETNPNFSTEVSVLLETTKSPISLSSAKDLYFKTHHTKQWRGTSKKIRLELKRGFLKPRLYLNSKPVMGVVEIKGEDPITLNGHTVLGQLRFIAGRSAIQVINRLPLNTYLEGTLLGEMPASWPLEALKAQAIASRSYVLNRLKHPRSAHFALTADTLDQVYQSAQSTYDRIHQAVVATEGLVLGKNGSLVGAYFHSRCGGRTTNEKLVWDAPTKYHSSVECEFCQSKPFRWRSTISAQELLASVGWAPRRSQIVLQRERPQGRVQSLKFKLKNKQKNISANTLRERLGYERIKSALFRWSRNGDRVTLKGQGNGHGVGMCQWGAQHMARQGSTYQDILSHYYPQLSLYRQQGKYLLPLKNPKYNPFVMCDGITSPCKPDPTKRRRELSTALRPHLKTTYPNL